MNHWNYRVVRKLYPPDINGEREYVLGIHEVYYDDNGEPEMVTEERMDAHGETLDELRTDLRWMLEALDKPVLEYDDFGKPPSEERT